MKHLSMWLTVLLLGALPLAAAALDYGPERPLLAANEGVAQAPGMQMQATSRDARAIPGVGESTSMADAPGRALASSQVAPPGPSRPAAVPSGSEVSARNKPRPAVPTHPDAETHPPSWRSLLPGSIQ